MSETTVGALIYNFLFMENETKIDLEKKVKELENALWVVYAVSAMWFILGCIIVITYTSYQVKQVNNRLEDSIVAQNSINRIIYENTVNQNAINKNTQEENEYMEKRMDL